jgi:hypothetical protein
MNVAPPSFPDSLCEQRLRNITLFIARVGLAYFFLSQLFWKLLFGNPQAVSWGWTCRYESASGGCCRQAVIRRDG